jgi:glycosyltransferase involved in cell wall biosynthesis
MKLGLVIQRYGMEINGGAELHARYIAEMLLKRHEIEVLTTRALDYVTWENHYSAGIDLVNGVTVRRFSVKKKRDPIKFGQIQNNIFYHPHTELDELAWLKEEGPFSPALIEYIKSNKDAYDFMIFFSYRYYQSYHGVCAVPEKSILVPTAEHDGAIELSIFKEFFKLPKAIVYNSHEEKRLIQAISNNYRVPGDIVGIGSIIPTWIRKERFKEKYNIDFPYIIYVGRIDENKGCKDLFTLFLRYIAETKSPIHLILIGSSIIDIPKHKQIHHFGFLSDEDKFSAIASSELLVMPSFYESLSMVLLEAWAMEKPALANSRCKVLKGQCIRSNAGLFYENYQEFKEALSFLLNNQEVSTALGRNGAEYYKKHYSWDVIEQKYERTFSMAGSNK